MRFVPLGLERSFAGRHGSADDGTGRTGCALRAAKVVRYQRDQ
jgi:hypothetical protein